MFDPTAFDNMKVVMEGALYDLDILGEISITDRNDWINMAKMSRRFNICFILPEILGAIVSAKIEMEANLVNLAAELLPNSLPEQLAGCHLKLVFFFEHTSNKINYQEIENILADIWGSSRKITQTVQLNPVNKKARKHIITVEFDRLISEDQMDDLVEMTDFMMTTIQRLQTII